jgi:hypothetical protein
LAANRTTWKLECSKIVFSAGADINKAWQTDEQQARITTERCCYTKCFMAIIFYI